MISECTSRLISVYYVYLAVRKHIVISTITEHLMHVLVETRRQLLSIMCLRAVKSMIHRTMLDIHLPGSCTVAASDENSIAQREVRIIHLRAGFRTCSTSKYCVDTKRTESIKGHRRFLERVKKLFQTQRRCRAARRYPLGH